MHFSSRETLAIRSLGIVYRNMKMHLDIWDILTIVTISLSLTFTLYCLISCNYFSHPPNSLLSDNNHFIFCIYDSVMFVNLFYYFRFHTYMKSHSIFLSLLTFHSAEYSLGPSMLMHMARFHSFFMNICIYHIFLIHYYNVSYISEVGSDKCFRKEGLQN